MKSIDKLREWADGLRGIWLDPNDHSIIVTTCDDMVPSMDCVSLREHVNGILDGIEREVADMRDFCERLDDAATKREDVTLWGVDYTPLPVDADGVPIHIEDVMEWPDCSTAEVVGIGNNTFFYVEEGDDAAEWSCANDKIHHHAPTVEDVLREFAQEMNENLGMYTGEAIDADEWRKADERTIAEYAARLRLAEGVDE